MADPFAPLRGDATSERSRAPAVSFLTVAPVPSNAPRPPVAHPTLGRPTGIWCYRDAAGDVLGYVHRYDTATGKQFRPLTLWRALGGAMSWRWESWPTPRPLYGLDGLAERSDAPVLIAEGEKACDAAARLLPDHAAVASPNGSKSAGKVDWSPLRGRRVVIWPDADAAGLEYARVVARLATQAGAASVAIISPPSGVAIGWDAADAAAEGWDGPRVAALIESARPAAAFDATDDAGSHAVNGASGGKHRTPQRDTLIGLTELCDLWHDANRIAYVSFSVGAHHEHWPVRSRDFRMWLAGRFFEETGQAVGGQAIEDGIRILEARAVNEGPHCDPHVRIGRHEGVLYLDLCDPAWRAVEIKSHGWRMVEKPPVKFLRPASLRRLPEPEGGSDIDELRQFLNVRSDADFVLIVAWLVAALRDRGPYPILVINGEQGAGKSVFSRMVRSLVDPSAAPIRAMPRDDRDLVVSASNSHVLAFDNLSSVPSWFSDALCRLSTGGGFATRTLTTDREETIFEAQRPIILNGIPLLTDRADLADRAVTVHLRAITEEERRPEDDLWDAFERRVPNILGALLDAVCAALRNLASVRLQRSSRMADFEKWVTAAEAGLGWEEGTFSPIYRENRRNISDSAFEADPVAVAIRDFVIAECPEGYTGTATALLNALNGRVAEGMRKSRLWPGHAQALGNRIERIAPLLRGKGFVVDRRRTGERLIVIAQQGS